MKYVISYGFETNMRIGVKSELKQNKSEVGGVNPSRIPQPGNRVSCLCLRCVRACVRAKICARDSLDEGQVAKCVPHPPPPRPHEEGGAWRYNRDSGYKIEPRGYNRDPGYGIRINY